MSIVNVNVDGNWYSMEINDTETRDIRKRTYESNKKFLLEILNDVKDIPVDMRAILLQTIVRHYHYNIEEYAKRKIILARNNK